MDEPSSILLFAGKTRGRIALPREFERRSNDDLVIRVFGGACANFVREAYILPLTLGEVA